MFTVKKTKNSIVDVIVDLLEREYTMVTTDLYGQTIEPEQGSKLRHRKINELSEKLEELDILSMPVNEKNTLPIHLKNATLTYIINEEAFNTDGHKHQNLSALHKAIEQVISKTFGSYNFYQ